LIQGAAVAVGAALPLTEVSERRYVAARDADGP
jgi:hypothetical protein